MQNFQTVIGAFDDRSQAQRAVQRLVQAGVDRADVHIEQEETGGSAPALSSSGQQDQGGGGIGGFFANLFGSDNDDHAEQAGTYHEAVRRGSSIVVVDASDEQQAEQAASLLQEAGAVDVHDRARQWQQEGWRNPALQGRQASLRDHAPAQGREGVLDVVQEELQVGKRSVERGGVRIVQRVTEKPVREVVRLREEHATVDRRPVDREATAADLTAFKEGTLEVRETVEEPVVAKSARVVEEVRVGKEVREREQVVEDKVRRKDVDVQRLEGSDRGAVERERAVASDRGQTPLTGRDSEVDSTTSARKMLRKNNPSS